MNKENENKIKHEQAWKDNSKVAFTIEVAAITIEGAGLV